MRSRQLIAAVAALSAMASVGSVFAADSSTTMRDGQDEQFTSSTKAREQVRGELSQARTQGSLMQSEWEYPNNIELNIGPRGPAGARHSVRTRDEVRNELNEYRNSHNGQLMDYDREIYTH